MRLNARRTFRGGPFPIRPRRVNPNLVVCAENEIVTRGYLTDSDIILAYHILRDIRQQVEATPPAFFNKNREGDVQLVFERRRKELTISYRYDSNDYSVTMKRYWIGMYGTLHTIKEIEIEGLSYQHLYQYVKLLNE